MADPKPTSIHLILADPKAENSLHIVLPPRDIGGEPEGQATLRKDIINALKSNMAPTIQVNVSGIDVPMVLQQIIFAPPGGGRE